MPWTDFFDFFASVAKFAAMGIAFILVWTLRNAFIAGWNIHRFISQFESYRSSNDERVKDINDRLKAAGMKMSDFSDELQTLPERMRRDFVPRGEVELQFSENRVDRQLLRDEITDLWKRVNEREEKLRRR